MKKVRPSALSAALMVVDVENILEGLNSVYVDIMLSEGFPHVLEEVILSRFC